MTEKNQTNEDARFATLFQEFSPALQDDGFSERVMARIARRTRRRNIVLSAAAIIGGTIALWPLSRLAVTFGNGLLLAATKWHDPAWLLQNQLLIFAVILAGLAPFAIRWLEE
jgi:hypothetical protein